MPTWVLPAQHSAPRHAQRATPDPLGYRIAMATINVLFVIALAGLAVILLGPVAYGLGA